MSLIPFTNFAAYRICGYGFRIANKKRREIKKSEAALDRVKAQLKEHGFSTLKL